MTALRRLWRYLACVATHGDAWVPSTRPNGEPAQFCGTCGVWR